MNISLNEIYSIKLMSGEELVGKVTHRDAITGSLTLNHPLSVAPGPHGMGLMPALFTAEPDGSIELNTSAITMYAVTADQVRIKYIEATTGITTASKKILVG
jgi:hypothetical protein